MERSAEGQDLLADAIARDGYLIVPTVLGEAEVRALIEATLVCGTSDADAVLRRGREVYGVRDLLGRVPEVRRLAGSAPLRDLAAAVLGPDVRVVRGLYFDKTPAANWNLPWHQDLTIAARARKEVPGFGPWTRKAGIPHAHAPGDLLARMITIRLHLDTCGPENGPMRVLPGSHGRGRLSPGEVNGWAARSIALAVECLVPAGGAVVMRPLLLHASTAATATGHRRVIHLEYAAEPLPGGLEWYEADPNHAAEDTSARRS
jgi:hypothetical protein